ncbi:hypothetical protein [Lysobacter gummosus]
MVISFGISRDGGIPSAEAWLVHQAQRAAPHHFPLPSRRAFCRR